MASYIGIVHHDPGSAWGVIVPDLPGCFSAADDRADLPEMARKAVMAWLETAKQDGQAVPVARDIQAIRQHVDADGAVDVIVITVGGSGAGVQ